MQELDELRPAPRTTPTAVLWLMAALVVGGSGALIFGLEASDSNTLAATAKPDQGATTNAAANVQSARLHDPAPAVTTANPR